MKTKNKTWLYLAFMVQIILVACNHSNYDMPKVQIDSVTNITHNSVIVYARVTDDGGSTPDYSGMAWSDTPGVSFEDTITKVGDGYMDFKVAITELDPGKTYYIRPYCEDFRGGVLGNEMSFTTKTVETFTDVRDGNIYPVLPLGNLIWMGENLRYITEDGSVPVVNEKFSDLSKFGRLYTYEAANQACPAGWRIPTDDDWKDLERFIGVPEAELDIMNRTSNAGYKLMHPGAKYFIYGQYGSTNSTGFTVLPTGNYFENSYSDFGYFASFWSNTEGDSIIWTRRIEGNYGLIIRNDNYKDSKLRLSIRCVKDKP